MSTNVQNLPGCSLSTRRKFTMGISYLRSAIADVLLIQPTSPLPLIFRCFLDNLDKYGFGCCPKCYNINIRKKNLK